MNAIRSGKRRGPEAAVTARDGSCDYSSLCSAIAEDLSTSISSVVASAARLVGDLRQEIQAFLDQGGTYRDVARIFEDRGVDASPDAIRVALKRTASTPRKRAEPVVVPSELTAPDLPPQTGARSRASLNAEQTPAGSEREVGEEPQAEPTLAYMPIEGGAFSTPPSSEALHRLREPSIGRRPD